MGRIQHSSSISQTSRVSLLLMVRETMILLVTCKTDSYTSMFNYLLFVQGDFYFLPWQINQEISTLSNMFYFSNHQTGKSKSYSHRFLLWSLSFSWFWWDLMVYWHHRPLFSIQLCFSVAFTAKAPRFKRLTAEEREGLEQMKTSRFDNKDLKLTWHTGWWFRNPTNQLVW